MLSPRRAPPRTRAGFTPAPLPLRRAPTLVPDEPPEPPHRRALVRRIVTFVVVVGVAIGVIATASGSDAFKGATASVQSLAAAQTAAATDWWQRHMRQAAVADALVDVTAERDALALRVMELERIEREHARLVAHLDMAEPRGLDGAVGRVIARPTTGRKTLRLDIGSTAGVALGQSVIHHQGLVGQVVDVGPEWTDVLIMQDPLHGAAVVIGESDVHGTLRGTGSGLQVDYVIAGTEVQPGAIVRTSGEGGVHPAGIPVGTIASVSRSTGPMLQIDVAPNTRPDLMAEVLVVRSHRPVQP